MTVSTGQFGGVYWNGPESEGQVDKVNYEALDKIASEEKHNLGREFPDLRNSLRTAGISHGNGLKIHSRSDEVEDLLHDAISKRQSEYISKESADPSIGGGEIRAMGHPEGEEQWLQGMLFHPLTATGIPGDPLLKPGERSKDVENAFGTQVPEVEKSGLPRTLLGDTDSNPTTKPLDKRSRTTGAAYDARINVMHVRDESDPKLSGESFMHELGHARDKERILRAMNTKNMVYEPTSEGVADAYRDRFATENIMAHESKFDPLLNPERVTEIMREPITTQFGVSRLRGYGGNSHAWKNKMQQAAYALSRMRGAMSPTGIARNTNLENQDPYTTSRLLSEVQQTPDQIERPMAYDVTAGRWKTGGEIVHATTLEVGRRYKNNPSARALLDQAGLGDAGQFASVVHDLHVQEIRKNAFRARDIGRSKGQDVDKIEDPTKRSEEITKFMDNPNIDIRSKMTFSQPSFFDSDPNWDPRPEFENISEMDTPENMKNWMKSNKVKKPGRRGPSQWAEMKKANKKKPFSLFDL